MSFTESFLEQALIDAYADYRWQQVLDPLYLKLQQWKAGDLGHWEISELVSILGEGESPTTWSRD